MRDFDYLTRLTRELQDGSLALFVGGDLPKSISGLPSRQELAIKMARLNLLPETLSLAEVAQRVSLRGNRYHFSSFLREELTTTAVSPAILHSLIAGLPVKYFITTAYDDLLKRALEQRRQPFNHLVHSSQVRFLQPDQPTLIQLYGLVDQPDTLVVTEDDHVDRLEARDKDLLMEEVRRVLRQNVILIIGYDLSDPDFLILWRKALLQMGQYPIEAYAVFPKSASDQRGVWEGRNISVIEAEPLALIQSLSSAVSGTAASEPRHQDQADSIWRGRIADLENNIKEDLALLKDYEDALRYEDNPRRRGRYRRDIEDLRESVASHQREYDELLGEVTGDPPETMQLVRSQLQELNHKIDGLGRSQEYMLAALLERFNANDQLIVNTLGRHLGESDLFITRSVLDSLEEESVPVEEFRDVVREMRETIAGIRQRNVALSNPDLASGIDRLSPEIVDSVTLDTKHSLKLNIPIVPLLLSYEAEIGLQGVINLKAAWQRLVNRVRGNPKS